MTSQKSGALVLAIDQGTTGTTALLIDSRGRIVATADEDFEQFYPKPGWVEHDLNLIWGTVERTIQKVTRGVSKNQIKAIGITNQRETVGIWNRKTGKPYGRAIVWQCRRTADYCASLRKKGLESGVQKKTGLLLDPYFSGTKINWMLKNMKGVARLARSGEACVGTMDTFLIHRLSGGVSHVTDVSNASRTLLMNLQTLSWDQSLLKLFGVPEACLPRIVESSGVIGQTRGLSFLPDGIPISGLAGDQQSALFGQACFEPGQAKCTFGTGSFILMNTGSKKIISQNRLLTTVAWKLPGEKAVYALEGGAFVCGAAVQWLRDGLELFKTASEVETLAKGVKDTGGVHFVPALTGLGAPYWDANARGLITGITRGTTKAHVARATLEAMAFQNVEILSAMEKDSGAELKVLRVDGGASQNKLLMQMQADFMGRVVERPSNVETTSMGAAFLAGLGVGLWRDLGQIRRLWKTSARFRSRIGSRDRAARLSEWQGAVKRALS